MLAAYQLKRQVFLLQLLILFSGCLSNRTNDLSNSLELTDIHCISTAPQFISFEYCRVVHLGIYTRAEAMCHNKLLPIKAMRLKVRLLQKRANVYSPFVIDLDLNWCSFIQKRNNLILSRVLNIIERYTNLDKRCPIMTEYVSINMTTTRALGFPLPFKVPTGIYRIDMNITFNNIGDLFVKAYFVTKV